MPVSLFILAVKPTRTFGRPLTQATNELVGLCLYLTHYLLNRNGQRNDWIALALGPGKSLMVDKMAKWTSWWDIFPMKWIVFFIIDRL